MGGLWGGLLGIGLVVWIGIHDVGRVVGDGRAGGRGWGAWMRRGVWRLGGLTGMSWFPLPGSLGRRGGRLCGRRGRLLRQRLARRCSDTWIAGRSCHFQSGSLRCYNFLFFFPDVDSPPPRRSQTLVLFCLAKVRLSQSSSSLRCGPALSVASLQPQSRNQPTSACLLSVVLAMPPTHHLFPFPLPLHTPIFPTQRMFHPFPQSSVLIHGRTFPFFLSGGLHSSHDLMTVEPHVIAELSCSEFIQCDRTRRDLGKYAFLRNLSSRMRMYVATTPMQILFNFSKPFSPM